jgi:sulfite exporter TauE/SafE
VTALLTTALLLGAVHSLAPDHVAAIGVFVSRRPEWRRALAIGARWGVGHSLVIVIAGAALVLTGWRFPEPVAAWVERVVGVTLVVIGLTALMRALRVHGHRHEHDGVAHWHVHSHRRSESHDHTHHAALGMGMLHGLAGTGALVIALPLAATESASMALSYLLAFGVGTIVAMAGFGVIASWAVRSAGQGSPRLMRIAASIPAIASVVVGVWWVIAA